MKNSSEETEKHAEKLFPLFKDTMQKYDILIIGYGATADRAFAKFKEAVNPDRRIYWCEHGENETPSHLKELSSYAPKGTTVLNGVDFDVFMIELARELRREQKCFPPVLFEKPADHLLQEIKPIVELPEEIRGTGDILQNLKARLKDWNKATEESVSNKIELAMLKGEWLTVTGLEAEAKSQKEKDSVAWAYVMQGNALSDLAKQKGDETLYRQSLEKYEQAQKIKPVDQDALINWGLSL